MEHLSAQPRNMTFQEHPIPFRSPLGEDRGSYEIADVQHWVVVGILMPIVIGLYLLLVLICYYLFCKKENNWEQELQSQLHTLQQNSNDGSFTPPPSYAIFIGSGDSDFIPPSYKMLFPQASITNSVDSLQHQPEIASSSHSGSANLIDLSTPSNTIKLLPNQIHIVCETPSTALNFIQHVSQARGTHSYDSSSSFGAGPSVSYSSGPLMSSRLQGRGSQYLYFPFPHGRTPSPRQTMVPRCGSEDVGPTSELEMGRFEEEPEVGLAIFNRSRMRRGSSF
ncbi:uncharacterized protein LOC131882700 [Tigriopus californicus]|uniref:uncharacterized protein LOC131882700 n=1 Tax=Tigriopus californicus TaxID=6832 RepID=UPI0027D9E4D7|nr:uncharacterized protein LOC131882700 [Tigriopus californicus]